MTILGNVYVGCQWTKCLFQVNINGRSYWAPFFYNSTGYDCSKLYNGWSRDETIRNWACYTAKKMGAQVRYNLHYSIIAEPFLVLDNKTWFEKQLFWELTKLIFCWNSLKIYNWRIPQLRKVSTINTWNPYRHAKVLSPFSACHLEFVLANPPLVRILWIRSPGRS